MQNTTAASPPRSRGSSTERPSTQQSELLAILILGSLLVYGGTPIIYAAYAATQYETYSHRRTPLPLLTDMFGDWPLLSSAVVGVGITLLFTGLIATAVARIPPTQVPFHPRTKVVRYSVVTQASVWLVIPSSEHYPAGDDVMDWVHNIFTFVFMVSSVYMLLVTVSLCDFFVEAIATQPGGGSTYSGKLRRTCAWARYSLWVAAAAVVGATVSVSIIALGDWPAPSQVDADRKGSYAPQVLWQSLVACELIILFFSGAGYALVIYTYAGIEAAAQEVVNAQYAPVWKDMAGSIWAMPIPAGLDPWLDRQGIAFKKKRVSLWQCHGGTSQR
jgi:hypothetical protein